MDNIDFGAYFEEAIKGNASLDPTIISDSIDMEKEQGNDVSFTFNDNTYKNIQEAHGKEMADKAKSIYSATLALNEHDQKRGLYNPIMTTSTPYTRMMGEKSIGTTYSEEDSGEFIYDGYHAPIRKETEQVIASTNNYYFENSMKKPLSSPEQMDEMGGNFFGPNKIFALMTNEDRAKIADEEGEKLKRAIDTGQLNAKAYFKDDSKKYVWKVLEEGEDHFDKNIRSIWGDETMKSDGYLYEQVQQLNDSAMNMLDAAIFTAKTVAYPFVAAGETVDYLMTGDTDFFSGINEAYSDYLAFSKSRLTRSSKEEQKGWDHNWTNGTKALIDGIVQIGITRGVGTGAAAIGRATMSKAALYHAGSSVMRDSAIKSLSNIANKSAMGFSMGYAMSSAYKEAKKAGLDETSAYMMSGLAGAVLRGTEKYMGGDWLYKVFGKKQLYGEFGAKVVKELDDVAKLSGKSIKEVAQNKNVVTNLSKNLNDWFTRESKNRFEESFKGFASEGIQETSEDFLNVLAQNTYDYMADEKAYKNDWSNILNDLKGSFVIGGLTGGLVGAMSPIANTTNKDINRFHYMIESEAAGNYENDMEQLKILRDNGLLGSYTLSSKATENNLELADEKSQNEFMYEVLKKQRQFVHDTANTAKQKFGSKLEDNAQGLRQVLDELIGQKYLTESDNIDFLSVKNSLDKTLQAEAVLVSTELDNARNKIAYSLASNDDLSTLNDPLESIEAIKGELLTINGAEPDESQKAQFKRAYKEIDNLESDLVKDLDKLRKEKSDLEFKKERRITKQEVSRLEKVNEEIASKDKELSDKLLARGLDNSVKESLTKTNDITDFLSEVDNRLDYYKKKVSLNILRKTNLSQFIEDYTVPNAFTDNKRINYYIDNYKNYIEERNQIIKDNETSIIDIDNLEVVSAEQKKRLLDSVIKPTVTDEEVFNLKENLKSTENKIKVYEDQIQFFEQQSQNIPEDQREEFIDEQVGFEIDQRNQEIINRDRLLSLIQQAEEEAQEYDRSIGKINNLDVHEITNIPSDIEVLNSRFLNANNDKKRLDQINYNIPSKIEELQQQEIRENNQKDDDASYDSGERNFDMSPAIEEIIKEIDRNLRDLYVQDTLFNLKTPNKKEIEATLLGARRDAQALLRKSREAKNQRWKKDYKLKLEYTIASAKKLDRLHKEFLSEIDAPVTIPSEILLLSEGMTEDDILEIDKIYDQIVDEEIRIGKALREKLNENNIDEFYTTLNLDDPSRIFHEMFKSKNLFDPEHPDNAKEDYYNYVNNLLRGYDAEFFDEYDALAQEIEDPMSSFEQLIAQRHIFKFLVSGNTILEDYVNTRTDWTKVVNNDPKHRGQNTLVARGYAGAGKTTHLYNIALRLAANHRNGINFKYSGYTEKQVEGLGNSEVPNANRSPMTFEEFYAISVNGINEDLDYLVFDEFSLLPSSLKKEDKIYNLVDLFDKINEINLKRKANNKTPLKVLFLGDEYQISGNTSSDTYPNIYQTQGSSGFFVEKTFPITTIYRTGKVDAIDFQERIRESIPVITEYKRYVTTNRSTTGLKLKLPNGEVIDFDKAGTPEMLIERINAYITNGFIPTYSDTQGIQYLDESSLVERFIQEGDHLIVSKNDRDRIRALVPTNKRENVIAVEDFQGREEDTTYVLVNAKDPSTYRHFLSELLVASSRDKQKMYFASNAIEFKSKQGRPDFFPDIKVDGRLSEEILEHNQRMKAMLAMMTGKERMSITEDSVEEPKQEDNNETITVASAEPVTKQESQDIEKLSKEMASRYDSMSQDEINAYKVSDEELFKKFKINKNC